MWRIKGWAKFQHFKDRRPPWIKLYRDILDDPDWHALDAASAKGLVMLWLIASEYEGCLPDTRKLAFRMRISEEKTKSLINNLSHWLEHVDDELILDGDQDDAPETEGETEKEKETERGAKAPFVLPDWIPLNHWEAWIESRAKARKAPTDYAKRLAVIKLENLREQGYEPSQVLMQSAFNGWSGLFPPKEIR